MKLKEKLFNVIFDNLWDHKESNIVPEVEKITEDFAVGFAKWFALNHTEEVFYEDNYTEEMLEKYKKEKGL